MEIENYPALDQLVYSDAMLTKDHIYNYINPITKSTLPQILVITSYPPRECGIATYSQDLIKALEKQFEHSFSIKVCALEEVSKRA
ncbi:MAG: hypothetical protein HYZ42_04685 [Bacteroidetes bacterium]|nr:hypothetical protein [Bacteroidota bacterium]